MDTNRCSTASQDTSVPSVERKSLAESDTQEFIVADTLTFLGASVRSGRVEYVIRNAVKRAWAAALAQASPPTGPVELGETSNTDAPRQRQP